MARRLSRPELTARLAELQDYLVPSFDPSNYTDSELRQVIKKAENAKRLAAVDNRLAEAIERADSVDFPKGVPYGAVFRLWGYVMIRNLQGKRGRRLAIGFAVALLAVYVLALVFA